MGDRLSFSKEIKRKAHRRARDFAPGKPKEVHHIVAKSVAKRFRLPTHLVKKDENAIALERNLHAWIHGLRLTPEQLVALLDQEISELEKQIDDEEIEWKGFDNDDYIFLAIALLGIDEKYFK